MLLHTVRILLKIIWKNQFKNRTHDLLSSSLGALTTIKLPELGSMHGEQRQNLIIRTPVIEDCIRNLLEISCSAVYKTKNSSQARSSITYMTGLYCLRTAMMCNCQGFRTYYFVNHPWFFLVDVVFWWCHLHISSILFLPACAEACGPT